ncbi:hypothetical protein [Hyunsoonleella pacifica]|uniref:hypothetical protein n=2 Tax=Hyunsoonleella pacifica TaxID=1080224 RepID=UPI001E43484F|nr:hypothetical protein [Hyunsoonleella pacifica]
MNTMELTTTEGGSWLTDAAAWYISTSTKVLVAFIEGVSDGANRATDAHANTYH